MLHWLKTDFSASETKTRLDTMRAQGATSTTSAPRIGIVVGGILHPFSTRSSADGRGRVTANQAKAGSSVNTAGCSTRGHRRRPGQALADTEEGVGNENAVHVSAHINKVRGLQLDERSARTGVKRGRALPTGGMS